MLNWTNRSTLHTLWVDVKTWSWRDLWQDPLTGLLLALLLFPILAQLALLYVTPPLLQFMIETWFIISVISLGLGMLFMARWWLMLLIGTTFWVWAMVVLLGLNRLVYG